MASSLFNISTYSRFNLSESVSDIEIFIREYGYRIKRQLANELEGSRAPFPSFVERKVKPAELPWIKENYERFFKDTPNESLKSISYLSEYGFITSIMYLPDGDFIVVGHSTGLIQGTPNEIISNRWYGTEIGAVTSMTFSRNGCHIIVGHASGAIQMRHGSTGAVLCTLRNIQFPPKPIYALEYSRIEQRVCYAACTDGAVYRIEIPNLGATTDGPPQYCIRADPALEYLNTQYYGAPGISSASTPFVTQRSPALSLGVSADEAKLIVGYADSSIKIYDMDTQEAETTYKVHKLRLQFIPKKLQRMHFGQVCALRCHDERPYVFASAAWDKTLRIWDTRCAVGCIATFEGVDICSDSLDINLHYFGILVHHFRLTQPLWNQISRRTSYKERQPTELCRLWLQRDQCIAGSWQPTEALTVWDIVARKRLNIVRVQNRRPDVDGEFIYACRYWRSSEYNRKGKYAIIGGSGTNCVEVINLHNRYITCSYPAAGTILAITSHEDRIAFGGTAPVLNIVSFYDPKHKKYGGEVEPEYEYTKGERYFTDSDSSSSEILPNTDVSKLTKASSISRPVVSSVSQRLK